eukprot:4483472-Amphidinium_carterae.1
MQGLVAHISFPLSVHDIEKDTQIINAELEVMHKLPRVGIPLQEKLLSNQEITQLLFCRSIAHGHARQVMLRKWKFGAMPRALEGSRPVLSLSVLPQNQVSDDVEYVLTCAPANAVRDIDLELSGQKGGRQRAPSLALR